jgi:LacI family transcriptional regulator
MKAGFNHMGQNRPATIYDIAKLAGVSIATVSRMLNQSNRVSKGTRMKIERAIEQSGYIPSERARGMFHRRSRTIALIMPTLSNPYYTELLRGVQESTDQDGYYVFVCVTEQKRENEHRYIKETIGIGVDGILFSSLYYCDEDMYSVIKRNTKALAIQGEARGIDSIYSSELSAGYEAARHLVGLGHRRIAYVCFDMAKDYGRYRLLKRALAHAGAPSGTVYVKEGYPAETIGYTATRQLLELPEPPTAIQYINDYTAMGGYRAIYEKGLRIPGDISVIGYDDIPIASLLSPPLTTIRHPVYELGRLAGKMLVDSIQSEEPLPIRRIRLHAQFVMRASTAPPRKSAL